MSKLWVALLAAVILAVLYLALVLGTSKPVTIHYLKASPLHDSVLLDFTISNATGQSFMPGRLERWSQNAWSECPVAVISFGQYFDPPGLSCTVTNLPAGRWRFVVPTQRRLSGLGTFWYRLKLRIRGIRGISLNPLDKHVIISSDQDLVSEEFSVP